MVYVYVEDKKIKALFLRKATFGQGSAGFSQKSYTEKVSDNVDFLASSVKENLVMAGVPDDEKKVILIIPPDEFKYISFTLPLDITPQATESFIKSKLKTELKEDVDDIVYSYIIRESKEGKVVSLYSLPLSKYSTYDSALKLLGLDLIDLLPSSVTYYELFEKTLRKDKEEKIFFLTLEKEKVEGYLFDSHGLKDNKRYKTDVKDGEMFESVKNLLNGLPYSLDRLILAGKESEHVRQDVFTKKVGVWANMLFRIVPEFYGDYLKSIIVSDDKPFPLLEYVECFGAFVFRSQKKVFLLKQKRSKKRINIKFPFKNVLIFLVSFILSFSLLYFLSAENFFGIFKKREVSKTKKIENLPAKATPTPTPIKVVKRSEIKLKILNGGGKKGLAGKVKDEFIKLGYEDVVAGNADSFDYDKTEVKFESSASAGLKKRINDDLKKYVSSFKTEKIKEKTEADVVIILGKDFEL